MSWVLDKEESKCEGLKAMVRMVSLTASYHPMQYHLTSHLPPIKFHMFQIASKRASKVDHFTYIILTLRPEHLTKLRKDCGRGLATKLAHIYYYYMCPDACPAFNKKGALGE